LHHQEPTLPWLLRAVKKEFITSLFLGLACGLTVGGVVFLWHGDWLATASIGIGIFFSMVTACLLGVLIPSASRALRLDPKIAAGPLTLALADILTLLIYFSLATLALGLFR
jgi:magnesium transporter